jgi:hypothetical protein
MPEESKTTPPGCLLLSTPVYGNRTFVNVIMIDGSLGVIHHDFHLEVRKVGPEIRVFDISTSRRWDAESRVIKADDKGMFTTIAEAAIYVTDFTSSYRAAAREDFEERRSIAFRQNSLDVLGL